MRSHQKVLFDGICSPKVGKPYCFDEKTCILSKPGRRGEFVAPVFNESLLSSSVALTPVIPHLAGSFFQTTRVCFFESSGNFPPVNHSVNLYREPIRCPGLCWELRSDDTKADNPAGKAKTQTEAYTLSRVCPWTLFWRSAQISFPGPAYPALLCGLAAKARGGPLFLRVILSG